MKAIAITPGAGNPELIDINEPKIKSPGEVKLQTLLVGICGTDRDQAAGGRSMPAAGETKLIIGHEMLGRVIESGSNVKDYKSGDLALFTVRRGCGQCSPCLNMRNDMCYTGKYLERGIKGLNGFQAEYVIDDEKYIIKVPEDISSTGVLIEPMSVVEKAIDEALKIQATRLPDYNPDTWLKNKNVLIAGLGPVGLLAAFVLKTKGAHLFGLDIVDEDSPRPEILKNLGGEYINGKEIKTEDIDNKYGKFDLLFEAAGIAKLGFQLLDTLNTNGVYTLTGIPEGERPITILGEELMRNLVLKNQVLLGSVNAGIDHYKMAVDDLLKSCTTYNNILNKLITEKVPYQQFEHAFSFIPDEIKTVIKWSN